GAILQERVVELAQIERLTERALGAGAEILDLELADLIGQGLAGPGDITVDLVGDVDFGLGVILHEKVDRSLPVPAHRVYSRVDHQAHRAPHLVSELPEL